MKVRPSTGADAEAAAVKMKDNRQLWIILAGDRTSDFRYIYPNGEVGVWINDYVLGGYSIFEFLLRCDRFQERLNHRQPCPGAVHGAVVVNSQPVRNFLNYVVAQVGCRRLKTENSKELGAGKGRKKMKRREEEMICSSKDCPSPGLKQGSSSRLQLEK